MGNTVVRPKWGVYRSLNHAEQLRDEQVLFDDFCLAKGTDDCIPVDQLPDFTMTATASNSGGVSPGGIETYTIDLSPHNGFAQNVSLSLTGSNAVPGSTGFQPAANLTGLPAAASAEFSAGRWLPAAPGPQLSPSPLRRGLHPEITIWWFPVLARTASAHMWPLRRWWCWAHPAM